MIYKIEISKVKETDNGFAREIDVYSQVVDGLDIPKLVTYINQGIQQKSQVGAQSLPSDVMNGTKNV